MIPPNEINVFHKPMCSFRLHQNKSLKYIRISPYPLRANS